MPNSREPSVATFLFTDIVGSTELTESLGDEGAQEILRLHNSLVRSEVARHGGSEVKAMGDGFMIAFRSVTSALACAVGIQRAIMQHNQEQPTREVMVRVGLNSGEAIQEEADFFGAAVIVAARIAALAEGGEILTSGAVKQLAQGMRGLEYEYKGEFQLRGLREPYQIYRVISAQTMRPAQAALRRPRFVGRQKELEDLTGYLEETHAGRGLFVLVTGEAGIGKSRLAEELARHARSRGFRVFRGRCYETEGTPPYVPFVEILREYAQGLPEDALRDDLGDDATEVAKLLPELGQRISVQGDGAHLPPEEERYRLLEAVRRWLERLALRRPTLLLIEDLHWARPAVCALLRHLARTLTAAPVFLLATCRKEGTEPSHPLAGALAEFGRLQVYRRLGLAGLTLPALEELLTTLGSGPPPDELVEALQRQTDGNPFFVAELVNHLHAEGRLVDPSSQWLRDFAGDGWEVPESVRAVIQRRLTTLNEDTRRVLTVASVVGRDFTYDLLEALGEVSAEALLDGLDEAIRMGMIEETEGAAARFRFGHELTRQTLYDNLSGLRRQRLHLRVAETMEKAAPKEPARMAYHFTQAGRMAPPHKTCRYLILSGDEASRTAAWEGAAAYYGQALELMAPEEEEQRATLLRRLGEAQSGAGNWEGAVSSWQTAMEIFERLGDSQTAGWTGYSLRRLYGARGQFEEASAVVQRSLGILGDSDSEIRSRLLAQAGFLRSAFGEVEEGERLLVRSMEIAQRLDNAAASGFAAFIRGMHCLSYCRLAEATEWLGNGAEWSLAGHDYWSASQATSFRRHILFTLGDLAQAEQAMDEEERLARRAGNFLAICETKWISGGIACLRGELARAEAFYSELLDLIEAAGADSGMPGALINLAYVRFLRGDWDGFEAPLGRAIDCYDRMSAAPIDDPRPVLLLMRALAGRADQARELLPELERCFRFDDHWTTSLGEARATLAAALTVLGEKEAAAKLYRPLADWTSNAGYVLTGASSIPQLVSRLLGMAAGAGGWPEEARKHFQTAIRQAREMEATTELAESCYWYARLLLEQGEAADAGRAGDLLSEAAGIWREAGMVKHLDRATSLESVAKSG